MARVEAGERFHITKRGKRIATVSPADKPRQPVDIAWLRSVAAAMPRHHDVSAGELMREERDRARY